MADRMEGVMHLGPGGKEYPVPIETVYVNNLEEREKVDDMKKFLTIIFKHYGEIVDIVMKTSLKRKGQAFVVFDSRKSALEAVEEMDGFLLHGKPMRVALAKTPSDATVSRKATSEAFDQHKRDRITLKERKKAAEAKEAERNPALQAEKARPVKTGAAAIPDEYVRPNKVLFLQNLAKEVKKETLVAIFERFEGFKEVRQFAARGIAFAEYDDDQFAITAKEATANMVVDGQPMKVTYQRQDNPKQQEKKQDKKQDRKQDKKQDKKQGFQASGRNRRKG